MHDLDLVKLQPEAVGHHLREGGLVPLAVAVRAGEDRHGAGRMHADLADFEQACARAEGAGDVRRCEAARFDVAGIAQATQFAALLCFIAPCREAFDVGQFLRARQAGLVVAGIVGQPHRGGVRELADEVLAAQFGRIRLQLVRGGLDQPFDHEGGFRPPRAAVGIDRRGVGEHRLDLGIDRRGRVLAGQQRRIQDGRHAAGKGRQVRAHVGDRMHAHRQELAVGIERQLGPGHVVAAMRVGQEGLATVRGPLDRAADLLRGPRQRHVFRIQEDLGTEAAAHVGRDDAQPRFRQPQHERAHQQAFDVRVLVGDVDGVAVVLARIAGVDRARLDRVGDEPVVDDVQRGHVRGLGEGGIGGGLVAVAPGVAGVGRHVVVHQRRRRRGIGGADHGGQLFVVDLDLLGGVARLLQRLGDDQRHLVAHVAHLALCDHRVRRLFHRRAVDAVDQPAAGQAADLVGTAITPGAASASVLSIERMRACAYGERRKYA
ncbi:hypothetical protein D9M69_439430 [compost metagenome]